MRKHIRHHFFSVFLQKNHSSTKYEEDGSPGKDLYAALADLVKEYDYPVCFNFPAEHVTHNLPLINGAKVEFIVGKRRWN